MRLGCGGCLTSLVMLGLLAMIGTSVWGTSRALQDPAIATVPPPTAEEAARAQQKLFRLVRGAAREPVIVSEEELTAFVSRNVDPHDLPFDQPRILLRDGEVEIVGQIPLGRLLAESPLGLPAGLLPARWSTRPIWLRVASRANFDRDPRPQLRLDVRRVTIGQQQVPAIALRVLFDPARLSFVRVKLPDTVGDVRIQAGRAVIRPTSSRERT